MELRRSGRVVAVPEGTSALQALLDAGVEIDYLCRNGFCGTCENRVLDGVVEHRDTFLSGKDRATSDRMLICVSRAPAGSRIVLDL